MLTTKIDTLSDLVRSIEDDHYPEPLDTLRALRLIVETATEALPEAVAAAREAEWPWTSIGSALGTSRQAAWERYSRSE